MSYKKGRAAYVHFLVVDATTGNAISSPAPTVRVFKDNSGVANNPGTPNHRYNGVWGITVSNSLMDADIVTLGISAAGAVPSMVSIATVEYDDAEIYAGITNLIAGVTVGFVSGATGEYPGIEEFRATGFSTFGVDGYFGVTIADGFTVASNIVEVQGSAITIGEFHADTSSVTANLSGVLNANVVQVATSAIASISDFHGDTSGLSTFDNSIEYVNIITNGIDADALDTTAATEIITALFGTTVDGSVDFEKVMQLMLAWMAGKVTVTDNGSTRTITFYRQDGTSSAFSINVSELDSVEGQRSTGGTIS